MVVHRRPAEIQAEVPTSVYALDLERLSELLSIAESDLVSGFQAHPTASEMHGVVVDAGEDVPFEAVGHVDTPSASSSHTMPPPPAGQQEAAINPNDSLRSPSSLNGHDRHAVRQVLLTAAARPSSLDSDALPKCLIQLGSQTIIGHILTQLYAAGIQRVVISVAAHGDKIIAAVKRTPFFHKMQVEFLDLGPDNRDGHARSILAARAYFSKKQPFLIHMADHIFDKAILTKFTHFPLNDAVACVLVETDVGALTTALPPTAVKVQLGKETVTKISRDLVTYDGIDAGLFLSSVAIFDALEDLAAKKSYFSLADALSYFTKFNKLVYVPTAGETWFSIETEEQLAYTKDTDGVAVLSPWTVFLASTGGGATTYPAIAKKNMVIGISAADQEASLRVAGNPEASTLMSGFVVGVGNAERMDDYVINSGEDDSDMNGMEEHMPLIPLVRRSTFVGSTRSVLSRHTSFIDKPTIDESFVISFPMDDETSKSIDNMATRHNHAYLIEMSGGDPSTPVSSKSQYMLAVPGNESKPNTPARPRRILPTDITEISLATRGHDEGLEVTLLVKRTAPFIGYMLLLSSLLTVSSVGVALDMVDNVSPLLKLFWRNTATALVSFPLALFAIRQNGPPPLDRTTVLNMLLAGSSYSYYLASYVISLSLTSVGHATLFNNSHSLLIVLVKLLIGQTVVPFEGIGTVIGLLGGAIATMDNTRSHNHNIVSPTAYGDFIALIGAFGGAAYFMLAKKLRPKMDLVVFMCALTTISACCLLPSMLLMGEEVSFDMDKNHGIIGWLNPLPDRLVIAIYLVLVCDLIGTMGYISVMKYFDPIVISVFCLLEPIVATVMGIIMGVDSMPGWPTFVGATLVIGGTILVLGTQRQKTEQIDATDAIRTNNNAAKFATPKILYSSRAKQRKMNYGSVV